MIQVLISAFKSLAVCAAAVAVMVGGSALFGLWFWAGAASLLLVVVLIGDAWVERVEAVERQGRAS